MYLPNFLSGSHTIISFQLLGSPPHLWVFPSLHSYTTLLLGWKSHYQSRIPVHAMKFLFGQIYNTSARCTSSHIITQAFTWQRWNSQHLDMTQWSIALSLCTHAQSFLHFLVHGHIQLKNIIYSSEDRHNKTWNF